MGMVVGTGLWGEGEAQSRTEIRGKSSEDNSVTMNNWFGAKCSFSLNLGHGTPSPDIDHSKG